MVLHSWLGLLSTLHSMWTLDMDSCHFSILNKALLVFWCSSYIFLIKRNLSKNTPAANDTPQAAITSSVDCSIDSMQIFLLWHAQPSVSLYINMRILCTSDVHYADACWDRLQPLLWPWIIIFKKWVYEMDECGRIDACAFHSKSCPIN